MRVLSLGLPSFKNLRGFRIDFDADSPLTALVGRNGTGKSNLLEALTIIFRDLDLSLPTAFPYFLKYICRGQVIEVDHHATEASMSVKVDGESVPLSRIQGSAGRSLRPDYVFGYYSGPTNRLEEHFAMHQERFYRDLVRGIERPLRPLFYARNVHSNFVLLAFFLEDDPSVRAFLADHLGIVDLDSVLFVMQRPSWQSKSGDARFWNARGTVRELLDQLYRLSLAPLRLQVRVPRGLSRSTASERLFLYLADLVATRELASGYDSNQEFFKALESTYISELMSDVRIRVFIERAETSLTFRELSEGEQQLLLVLGLMRFTREEESLFLLDEPDTHLNPAWSVQYRHFLADFGGMDESSHVILATHDPLLVGSLVRPQVRIFERRTEDAKITVKLPWEDPRGMGVGALLTSDVYGLRSQLDLETLQALDRKRELSARAPGLTNEEDEELRSLRKSLQRLELIAEDRDPEFQEYLRAKLALEDQPVEIVLTPEEVVQQRELAREILEDLEGDDEGVEAGLRDDSDPS